jgi:hypothetical protein
MRSLFLAPGGRGVNCAQLADECTPSSTNNSGAQAPWTHADRSAASRVVAPSTQKALFPGFESRNGAKAFDGVPTKADAPNIHFEPRVTPLKWLTWRRCLNDFVPELLQ